MTDVPDLVIKDLTYYGLGLARRLRGGGAPVTDIEAFDYISGDKYFYAYLDVEGALGFGCFPERNLQLVEFAKDVDIYLAPGLEDVQSSIQSGFGEAAKQSVSNEKFYGRFTLFRTLDFEEETYIAYYEDERIWISAARPQMHAMGG